jgi:hypothetical protein
MGRGRGGTAPEDTASTTDGNAPPAKRVNGEFTSHHSRASGSYWYWMYSGFGFKRSTSAGVSRDAPLFVSLW